MKRVPFAVAALSLVGAVSAQAQVQTVTSFSTAANQTQFNAICGGNSIAAFNASNANGGVAITGAQPRSGNGSLELQIAGQTSQAAAFLCGTSVTRALSLYNSLTFDFFGTNTVNTSPTIRLFISTGPNNPTLNLGYYQNGGLLSNSWQTSGNALNDAWLRIVGVGQLNTDCRATDGAFDGPTKRQSLTNWIASCNGAAGTLANLADATVTGIQVDFGTFGSAVPAFTNYADNVTWQFAQTRQANVVNFETNVVPEPSTYALMTAGLLGLVVAQRRRRRA